MPLKRSNYCKIAPMEKSYEKIKSTTKKHDMNVLKYVILSLMKVIPRAAKMILLKEDLVRKLRVFHRHLA